MSARKVWCVKYALKKRGIEQCIVTGCRPDEPEYLRLDGEWQSQKFGRDCFDTEAEANARAVELAHAKLKSLKRAKARVESMLEIFHKKAGAR